MNRNLKVSMVALALVGLAIGSQSALTGPATVPRGGAVVGAAHESAQAQPMIWHLVIRIALTKPGCENIRRIMPNRGQLKCVKAGKVWVLIPKGKGY